MAAYDYASHERRGGTKSLVQLEAVNKADGAHEGAMRRRAQRGHEREGDELSVFSFEVPLYSPEPGRTAG